MRSVKTGGLVALVLLSVVFVGCGKKQPPVLAPVPAPATSAPAPTPPPTGARAAERIEDPLPVPQEPLSEENIGGKSLDDLNRDSPFKPAFFGYDSAELDADAQKIVQTNGALLKKYGTWTVTIEGHCDERGTAEYNLALGERRAMAVKTYLISLGIAPDRLRLVSYGKEFPFDPVHAETAYSKNRRAHFVITAK